MENPPAESGFQSDSESKNTAPHPPPSGPMFPPRMMYHPMMSMPPGVPGMMPRPGMPPPFMMRHPYGVDKSNLLKYFCINHLVGCQGCSYVNWTKFYCILL